MDFSPNKMRKVACGHKVRILPSSALEIFTIQKKCYQNTVSHKILQVLHFLTHHLQLQFLTNNFCPTSIKPINVKRPILYSQSLVSYPCVTSHLSLFQHLNRIYMVYIDHSIKYFHYYFFISNIDFRIKIKICTISFSDISHVIRF